MPDSASLLTENPLWIAAPMEWREACFSLPATRALADSQALHVLCPDFQKSFWEAAQIGEVQGYDPSVKVRPLGHALPPIKQCLLWEDGVAAQAMIAAKVPTRLGLPTGSLARRLTHPITITRKPGPPRHRVRLFLDTAEHLGAGPFEGRHFAPLPSEHSPKDEAWLIAPGSDFGSHFDWPAERWIELVQGLSLDRAQARILGDGPIARDLADATSIELVESMKPSEFAAFGQCLAADSSVPHIAAAFGVTCSVLFGPGDPERTRPLGKQHRAIRKKVECSPCLMDQCPLDLRCQHDLGVNRVSSGLPIPSS